MSYSGGIDRGWRFAIRISDEGALIGTRLDSEWLRHRIWAPGISEVDGPYVRVALLGGPPDTAVLDLVAGLSPAWAGNVDSLLLIEHLSRHAWVDPQSATSVIQRSSAEEADDAIRRLADAYVDAAGSAPVISPVQGVPSTQPAAYRLSDAVRVRLAHRLNSLRTLEGRETLALDWSRARGRVSSTEVADLTGFSKVSAGKLLTRLADAGQLEGGRPGRRGRGFFYIPVRSGA